MNSFYLVSLGCPKNRVDSEVMAGLLGIDGYSLTTYPEEADIIIVNTCGFLEEAVQESLETVKELSVFKQQGQCQCIVVAGCLVQRYKDRLKQQLPEADLLVGTGEFNNITEIIEQGRKKIPKYNGSSFLYDHTTPRLNSMPPYTAYLKIAEGCSRQCSFCLIPSLRGPLQSRTIDDILLEANNLKNSGVKELNLISQDLSSFGSDLKPRVNLEELLRQLSHLDIPWIRLLYNYHTAVSEPLLGLIRECSNVVNYLDIPLQHVSDPILRSMKRGASNKSIRNLLAQIDQIIPQAVLRTALITGYPGETEQDFLQMVDLIEQEIFDHLVVFPYSNEDGSESAKLDQQIDPETVEERYHHLMALQQQVSLNKNLDRVGESFQVLLEDIGLEEELTISEEGSTDKQVYNLSASGRYFGQAPEVDGQVKLIGNFENYQPGDFVQAKIIDALSYDLIGELSVIESFKDPD